MTSNVVVGKRVKASGTPAWVTWSIAAVVLVVLSVRSFIEGDTAFGAVFAVAGVVVALAGRALAGDEKRGSEILSGCPVCGVQRQRRFDMVGKEQTPHAACAACIAYLRLDLDSLQVKEEPDDATGGFYFVGRAQYESIVPRSDENDRPFNFVMPTICAVCGAPEAPVLRPLSVMTTTMDAGILGAVASEVANDAVGAKATRRYESNTPSSDAELDLALRHVEMHVCDKHTSIVDHGVEYGDGNLAFHSYRHYKAFCELNHIKAETKPSEVEGPPQARVARH